MDRLHPHLSRCSAYVEFETPEEAQKALKYMDGGRTVVAAPCIMQTGSNCFRCNRVFNGFV